MFGQMKEFRKRTSY